MTVFKLRLFTLLLVSSGVIMIFIPALIPSIGNQRMYFAQPITNQLHEIKTSFSPELTNPNCSLSGYILVLRYSGQQGGGVKSLVSLQRWVRDVSLPMMIVEPFIQDSVLGAYRKSFHEIKFSDMFDLDNFNRVSRSEGVTELISWERYVNSAPIHAVLVRLKATPRPTPSKVVWVAQPGSNDCWQNHDKVYNIKLNKRHICYTRVVNYFISSLTLSAEDVHSVLLAGLEVTRVNLVFDLWATEWKAGSAHTRHTPSYFSDRLSVSHVKNESVFLTHKLEDSLKISVDVKNYQQLFLNSPYVAVMLRTEYVLMQFKRTKHMNLTLLQGLFDETVNVTTMVMAELGIKDVFVTADIGLYGSKTWGGTMSKKLFHNGEPSRVEEQTKHTVEKLYRNKWTFEKWEKSFSQATRGVEDRGYIAGLQRGIASQASCLIMLGGGSFQSLTLKSYIGHTEQHKRCIRFVGTQREINLQKLYALKNIEF